MPVYHAGPLLAEALAAIARLDFSPQQIEVLVAGPADDADSRRRVQAQAADSPFPIHYIPGCSTGRPALLNAACAQATGTYLAFLDDDVFPDPDWLNQLLNVLTTEPNVGLVGGSDELTKGLGAFDVAFDCVLGSFFATAGCRTTSGVQLGKYYPKLWNMAMPRALALDIAAQRPTPGGLFDQSSKVHEDVELGERVREMQKRIIYAPQVHVKHRRETSLQATLKRDFEMARACRSLGIHRLPHLALLIAVFTAIGLGLFAPFYPTCALILLAGLGCYLILVIVAALNGFLRTRRPAVLVFIPLLLVSLHAARFLGYLIPRFNSADPPAKTDKNTCFLLALVLLILYGLCQNGQWIPGGGDDAYYLAIARNLATGQGYFWNQVPVLETPPGWPAFLALLMRLSPSFAFLNLVLMATCIAAACVWFFIMRRFVGPLPAFLLTILAATLFEWHRFSFTFYSESLFFLLTAICLLLAIQINEKRPLVWRLPLLLAAAVAMVLVRWTGLLFLALPASALVTGHLRPAFNRKWIAVILLIVVSFLTFKTTRVLQMTRTNEVLAVEFNPENRTAISTSLDRADRQEAMLFGHPAKEYLRRASNAGRWVSTLLLPPAVVARGRPIPQLISNLLGWTFILLLTFNFVTSLRRGQWIWIGLLLFSASIVLFRHTPIARYLAPAAPLLLLGIWRAVPSADDRALAARARRIVPIALLICVALCNSSILTVNAWVARSPDFLNVCLAGEYRDILSVAEHLQRPDVRHARVGVYAEYNDLIRTRRSLWAQRVLIVLADRYISCPARERTSIPDDQLLSWAADGGINYIVTRSPNVRRRLWHVKIPSSRDDSTAQQTPHYILLDLSDNKIHPVPLADTTDGLRSVPGL